MSKQKTDLSETEKPEVTENLVEQSELEGISSIKKEEVIESKPEIEKPVKVANINRVTTAAVKGNKKMNVSKFLLYYPQDIYVEALLRHYYPRSFFTVDEWFLRIEEILNMPINS